jgi:hypothetical protein
LEYVSDSPVSEKKVEFRGGKISILPSENIFALLWFWIK